MSAKYCIFYTVCMSPDNSGHFKRAVYMIRNGPPKPKEPDLMLFVDEALLGNDSVDQLMMFSRAVRAFLFSWVTLSTRSWWSSGRARFPS